MLQMPKRSVTRFFIPLIDVLTLLFCVFLVMPAAQPNPDEASGGPAPLTTDKLYKYYREGQDKIRKLEEELKDVRGKESRPLQERIEDRVLEIDGKTGKLYYYDRGPVEIPDEATAVALIEADKRKATRAHKEVVHYIILYPRDPKRDKPNEKQMGSYRAWFSSVKPKEVDPLEPS
jgi:hypothetical protein